MTFDFRLTRPTKTLLDAGWLEQRGPLEDPSDYVYLAMRGCADLAHRATLQDPDYIALTAVG